MTGLRFSPLVLAVVTLLAPGVVILTSVTVRGVVLARRALWDRLTWWYARRMFRALMSGRVPHGLAALAAVVRWRRRRRDRRAMRRWGRQIAPRETSQPVAPPGR